MTSNSPLATSSALSHHVLKTLIFVASTEEIRGYIQRVIVWLRRHFFNRNKINAPYSIISIEKVLPEPNYGSLNICLEN